MAPSKKKLAQRNLCLEKETERAINCHEILKHTKEAKMGQNNNHQKGIFISAFSIYEQKFCKRILKIHRNLRLGGKSNHNKTSTKWREGFFVYWSVCWEISHGKTLFTRRTKQRTCLKFNYQQSDWKIQVIMIWDNKIYSSWNNKLICDWGRQC